MVVAAALCDQEGRFLMQKRPPGKAHGGLWEFPGGKIEAGESPCLALIREIREELGVALDPGDLFPVNFAESAGDSDGPSIVILLYRIERWAGEPASIEGGEIGWFTRGEAVHLKKPELDHDLLKRLF